MWHVIAELTFLVLFMRVHAQLLSCVQFFASPWTVASQASLCMEFSRQEYCCGLLLPTPRDLPDPGIEPMSLESPAQAGELFITRATMQRKFIKIFKKIQATQQHTIESCVT